MKKNESEMTWKDLEIGAIVTEPGTTRGYRTGDWRSQVPRYDFAKCIKCGLCQLYCPEGCIKENEEGYFYANLFWCKGCGTCARECPTGVISMKEEAE
ncbi:MAG: 4Fe-4S binding protein [Dehalococcoidales bacterium]|nr:4Fe-4S binding protein [Dehalococcoidales bacterium]